MAHTKKIVRRLFAVLTCVALVVWSVTPSFTHAPAVFETVQDHLEMVENHGHSHGFAEDLHWAMHGHSHDAADHDHNQAFLMPSQGDKPSFEFNDHRVLRASNNGVYWKFRIDRPPRA
jgi:hypothetical protein